MICERTIYTFCNGDITKIENYEKANAFECPEGFVSGLIRKPTRKVKYCWITNGEVQKMIPVNQIIPNGFFPGHLPKRK